MQAAPNPRRHPPIVTGLVGGGLALVLFLAKGYFWAHWMEGKASTLPTLLDGLPLELGRKMLAREFPDTILILALTFLAMAAWEKLADRAYRAGFVLWLVGTVCGSAAICAGLPLLVPDLTIDVGTATLWRLELWYALALAALLLLILVFALHRRRQYFRLAVLPRAAKAAFWRWLTAFCALVLVWWLSLNHPMFGGDLYIHWKVLATYLVVLFPIVGLPYFVLTHWLRYGRDPDSADASFGLLVVAVHLAKAVSAKGRRRLVRLLRRKWVRVNLMDLFFVKFFFLPLMIGFVFIEDHVVDMSILNGMAAWEAGRMARVHYAVHDLMLHGILVLDAGIGTIGYACSSRWLGNKSRSVDPTMLGWTVALMCYPPFNQASGVVFPFRATMGTPPDFLRAPDFVWTMNWIAFGLYIIFVLATLAFGLRFSNMTHRGIIRHGPYAVVRHPAYVSKFFAWWAETLPTFGSGWQAFGLLMFGGVYFMRAITEERHLMQDPEYQDYCRQVRWRFIPGVY